MNQILNDYIFNNYVVIGVSAGPDSMCLLNILQKKTNKIIVCHINHNVRKESIEEEEYITKYCKDNNLILEKMTIKNYQENKSTTGAGNCGLCDKLVLCYGIPVL